MSLVPALDLRPDAAKAAADAPPANIEIEQALLGIVLYDNDAYHRFEGVRAAHFYEPFHGRLWQAIASDIEKGLKADPVTVMDRFVADPAFDELGGIRYLADLVDRCPSVTAAPTYAAGIIDLAMRRDVQRICAEGREAAKDFEIPSREVVAGVEQELYALAETTSRSGFRPFSEVLVGAMEMAAEAYNRDGSLTGLATGLTDMDKMTGGLHPSDLIIVGARPSMGKAQDLSAAVLRRDGTWARMGDLRLGDELASIDGAPSRVAGIFPQGRRRLYRITLGDGRSTRACAEHLWLVNSSKIEGGSRVVSTERLAEMMRAKRFQRRVSLPLVSGHFGQDHNLPMDAWLLGALIGNGCMRVSHLAISTADAKTLYRVQEVIGHQHLKSTGTGGYDYRISRGAKAGVAPALRALGLYGKDSAQKFIPPVYMAACRETRMELLRGLLDTNGWVETFGAARYCTVSHQLAHDVQTLVRSIGGVCTISEKRPRYEYKGEKLDGQLAYTLNISHPDRAALFSLARKKKRCREGARFHPPTIISVEPEDEAETQCIRVTHPSSLYVTDDYVVTHNTAMGLNIAFHAAKNYRYEPQPDGSRKTVAGGRVGVFSLEMSAEQLAFRLVAQASGVAGDKLRKGEVEFTEFSRVRDAANLISEIPLHIDDTGGLTIGKLAARARRLKRTHGLDLVVVDYIQLLAGSKQYTGGQRTQEVTEITVGLKALAKELKCPIVALAQLSRKVEDRDDKKPQLSDLRESGSIEQDADMVIFLYREEYYLGRAEPKAGTTEHVAWQDQMEACAGQAEAIIAKQRHGPIGTVRLNFNGKLTMFSDRPRESTFTGNTSLPYAEG